MKKSFKKILFTLLTLLSVLLIVSCGDKLSKKEVIEKFVENSKNMKSADITMNLKMEQKNSISPSGITLETTGNLSLILEPSLVMRMDLVVPFNNNKVTMYMKDDYSYVQNPDNNQWIKQSNKGFGEQFKMVYTQSNAMYDFLMKNIDKIDLKEKNGNYLLIIKDLKDIFKKELASLNIPDNDFNMFDNLEISFLVDKKKFLPISITMAGVVDIQATKMNILFEANYSNINDVKEITIPKEALEAKEIKSIELEETKDAVNGDIKRKGTQ